MDKPVPHPPRPEPCLIWHEVEEWFRSKGIYLRDFAHKFHGADANLDAEYQDFWHSIVERYGDDIHSSGSYFSIPMSHDEWEHEWERKIVDLIRAEFGEHVKDDEIEFYVEW